MPKTGAAEVVVTGVAPITATGVGREAAWKALLGGTDGSREVRAFSTDGFRVHRACEIDAQALEPLAKALPRWDDALGGGASRLATIATGLALADAGLPTSRIQAGLVLGTTSGEIRVLEAMHRAERDGRSVPASTFAAHACHQIVANVAEMLELEGPGSVVPTACAAGAQALAVAHQWITQRRANIVLAGGVDVLSEVAFTGFARLGAIAPDRCRPFDRDRKGLLIGEGAGVLVLESSTSARSRGAVPYARLAGHGQSCDAHHMTIPHPDARGAHLAMQRALMDAQLPADAVDYVSAHGTGTRANDVMEVAAIRRVLGPHADRVVCSSIKSMIGHTMGAAGALGAIAAVLAIRDGMVPPTLHHATPDPDCNIDVVPNRAREHKVRVALCNAFAFGGVNCCLAFKEAMA